MGLCRGNMQVRFLKYLLSCATNECIHHANEQCSLFFETPGMRCMTVWVFITSHVASTLQTIYMSLSDCGRLYFIV
ncbi:hypothetical protein FOCC_FOCC013991 [Frankliniella occidentalis]|nr:hypothetical protein FOCC_FOCC013991 [Frankliniella occidentalis]